jgi:hypothetical protein
MLKLCQLMKVLAEVLMVSCEPSLLKLAAPWETVPPVGLALAGDSKNFPTRKDSAMTAVERIDLAAEFIICAPLRR